MSSSEPHTTPLEASVRKHLGLLADEWLQARIEVVRKLKAMIILETDPDKLIDLQGDLRQALISSEDVAQLETKSAKILTVLAAFRST